MYKLSDLYEMLRAFLNRPMQSIQDVFYLLLLWTGLLLGAVLVVVLIRIVVYKGIRRACLRTKPLVEKIVWFMVVVSILCLTGVYAVKDNAEQQLVLNEICSKNNSVLLDAKAEYSDYIELHNSSEFPVSLKGFSLSDNADEPWRLVLEDVVIPAGGHYIVWTQPEEGTGFRISVKGETIALFSPSGEPLDSVEVPELTADIVYARESDGGLLWSKQFPSPMAENAEAKKYVETPVFSAESGFYEEAFALSLSAKEGEKIYYTLDGSTPDENATLYGDAITVENVSANPNVYREVPNVVEKWRYRETPHDPVDKVFIVRAIAVDEAGNTSDVVTKSYFVDMDKYRDHLVLSLVPDPEDMFGDYGIYVTGKEYDDWYLGDREGEAPAVQFEQRGRDYEIETSVELFRDTLLMSQQAGLRIQGASERKNALKRFSLFSRKEYSGDRYFEYDLFGQKMHSFFMRYDFEDALIHSLVTDRNLGGLGYAAASVFVDGEFWYDTYLREKYSEDYLSFRYKVNRDDVLLVEAVPDEIYDFLEKSDLSKPEDYMLFSEMMDIQNYIDYMAANIYACNMDGSENKNCRMWKSLALDPSLPSEGYNDGKWRWLVYDMDSISWNSIAYYQAIRYNIDSFSQNKEFAGVAYNQSTVYKALRVNEEFCRQFVLTFMDLANTNFSVDNVAEKIADFGLDTTWGDGFWEYRYDAIVPCLAKEFELQGTLEPITLSVSDTKGGYVKINTVEPKLKEGSWTGNYYTDYPVTVTAVPEKGYVFVGWRDSNGVLVEEEVMEVQLTLGGCHWEAVFQKHD